MRRSPVAFEARWGQWLLERNRRRFRTALWIALALIPCFGILDFLVGASALRFLWTTRLLVIAGNVAMFPLRRARTFDRHPELVTAAYCVMIASGISAMTLAMGGLASEYYAGLSLVIVGAGLLFVWRPATAAITHLLIISSFVSPNLMVHGWPTEGSAFSNLAFLLAIAVVGGIGQVVLYRSQREQVFNQVALEETKANLETAHEQLKQLDRFKSQFFANITHEFKTPLAMILSPLELLLHGEVGEIGPTQRATFEMMFRSGMKLLKMIGDLLDLSKLEESRLRLKISEHDLAEHLRNLCEQVQPLAQRKRIETKLVASGTCLVNCDLERMERVFVNLLSNALKFTREGGHVTVSLHDLGDIAWIVLPGRHGRDAPLWRHRHRAGAGARDRRAARRAHPRRERPRRPLHRRADQGQGAFPSRGARPAQPPPGRAQRRARRRPRADGLRRPDAGARGIPPAGHPRGDGAPRAGPRSRGGLAAPHLPGGGGHARRHPPGGHGAAAGLQDALRAWS